MSFVVRRPQEGFQYSAVMLYCAAVGVRASRVVAAARGVVSLTRSPESPDTAEITPKHQFAHQNVPANYIRMAATHWSVYFPNDLGLHSMGRTDVFHFFMEIYKLLQFLKQWRTPRGGTSKFEQIPGRHNLV